MKEYVKEYMKGTYYHFMRLVTLYMAVFYYLLFDP